MKVLISSLLLLLLLMLMSMVSSSPNPGVARGHRDQRQASGRRLQEGAQECDCKDWFLRASERKLMTVPRLPKKPCPCDRFKGRVKKTSGETEDHSYSDQKALGMMGLVRRDTALLFRDLRLGTSSWLNSFLELSGEWAQVPHEFGAHAAKLPTPIITSNNSNPLEHEDTVVLTCEPETQNTTYMWWINNQSLPDSARLELSEDNKTLTLLHVTRNDTGPYVCETQNPVSAGRSDPFTINVLYPVAQPSIQASNTNVTEHGDTVFLTCLTNDTGISISWLFNGQSLLLTERMKLSQGNSTLTIHPVRREDAGNYQCQVSNLGYSSKSDVLSLDVTYDSTQGSSSGLSDGAIASIVIGAVAALVYFLYIRNTGRSGTF